MTLETKGITVWRYY